MNKKLNMHSKKGLMPRVSALLCVLGFASAAFADVAIDALPTNGQVTAGVANISAAGSAAAPVLNINQASQRAVVSWDKFDVGANATVNFNQPNAQASTLNRINSNNPSQIMGKINAPGEVILMNQQGVYFTRSATLDVGSVVATSHNISDADYMAGKSTYDRNGATGKVINEGNIKTGLAGYVALLAPEVRNSGVIVAQMGTVVMAAGERITLNFDPSKHLASITATPSAIDALIENHNAVKAPGGLIILSARAVNSLVAGVIKQSGTLSVSADVNTVVKVGGRIMLSASSVKLEANSQTVARGANGGGNVEIAATKIVTVEPTAKVSVSATETGHAGTINIHADEATNIQGTLLAQGGKVSGNGGTINTTSNGVVQVANTAEIKAGVRGTSGNVGTWNIKAAAFKVDATNAPVISQSINKNNVSIKVSSAACANSGNCAEVANIVSNAGLNLAQLEVSQDAVISKTSPVLTSLVMESSGASDYNAQASGSPQVQNKILVDGKIISTELSPLTLQILSDNLVDIRQSADLKAAKIEVISENGLYNGTLLSYFAQGDGTPLPVISLLARTLAIAGSLKSGSQNRAGSIKIAGSDQVSIENAQLIANGNDGGNIEIVSMNGTVSVVNSVVQTNGGEGRGGAISVAGLQSTILSGSTLEATGINQGGKILIGNDAKNGTLPFSAHASLDALTLLNAQALNPSSNLGGFIETSGHILDQLAKINAGRGGMWLIDPYDITIASSSASGDAYNTSYTATQSSTILASSIVSSLNAGVSVSISTGSSGNALGIIYVNAPIIATGSGALTLNAGSSFIYLGSNITTYGTQTYTGNVLVSGSIALTSNNSNITFNNNIYALTSTTSLSIDAGTGNVNVTGKIGYVGGAMTLGASTATLSNSGSGNLDTIGVFIYAAAFGSSTSKTIGDVTFVGFGTGTGSTILSGVTVYNDQAFAAWGGTYGTGNLTLDTLLQSMVWTSWTAANTANANYGYSKLGIDLTGLIPGATYKVQLLSSESCCITRYWNIDFNNGSTGTNVSNIIFSDFSSVVGGVVNTARLGSYVFTAEGPQANVTLNGLQAGKQSTSRDPNAVISAMSLEIQSFEFNLLSFKGAQVSLNGNVTTSSSGSLTINNTAASTISTVLAGGALTKQGAGLLTLSGANTYTGVTTLSGGTLSVATLAKGAENSNIGASSNAAASLVFDGGTLKYTGAAVSSDRLFTLTGNGGTIDSSGTGALAFTNAGAVAYTGTSTRTLTLMGTANGTFSQVLADNTGASSLTKSGAGTWVLSGTNTYTGTTTISAGTLQVGAGGTTGSLGSGDVVNNAALKFDLAANTTIANNISGTGSIEVVGRYFRFLDLTSSVSLSNSAFQQVASSMTVAEFLNRVAGGLTHGGATYGGTAGVESGVNNKTYDAATNTGSFYILWQDSSFTKRVKVDVRQNGANVEAKVDSTILEYVSNVTAAMLDETNATAFTGDMAYATAYNTDGYGLRALDLAAKISFTGNLTHTGATTLSGVRYGTAVATCTGFPCYAKYTKPTVEMVGSLGSSAITNNGILIFNSTAVQTLSGIMSGSGVVINNATANVTLSGVNTFSGKAYLQAGTTIAGNIAAFGTAGVYQVKDLASTIDVNGKTITNSFYLYGDGASSAGAITNGSATAATISGAVALTGNSLVKTDNAMTISGIISGANNLAKAGTGTLTLSNTNTYTGNTTITAGTLAVSATANLGSASNVINLNGGTLSITGTTAFSSARVINVLTGSTINNSDTGGITFTGNVTGPTAATAATLTINGANATSFTTGVMANGSGTGAALSLTQNTTGTTTLSGTNTYTGIVTITAGILSISNDNNLGAVPASFTANEITLSGGALQATGAVSLNANRGVTMTANSGLAATSTNTLTVNGIVTGAFGLTINGASQTGTVTLAGANTYTGVTTVSAGILSVSSDTNLGTGNISLADTLAITGTTAFSSSKTFTLTATSTISNSNTGGATLSGNITNGANGLTINTSQAMIMSGIIGSGAGGLTKLGSGALTLSGANTFTGAVTLTTGSLLVTNNLGLGTTAGGVSVASGTTLDLQSVTVGAEAITLNGGTLAASTGSSSLSGTVALGANSTVSVGGTQLTLSGIMSGASLGITKTGAGMLVLSGANTYSGGTVISAGILQVNSASALGSEGAITFGGGTLQYTANNTTDYSARFSNAASQAFNIDTNGQSVTFVSALSSSGGTLTKLGAGSLTLSVANTYTGITTITAGTLSISSDSHLGSVPGSTIANAVTLNGGTLQVTADITISANRGITLAAASTINVASGNKVIYLGTITDGSGTFGLTKDGGGLLKLVGASTYDGGTTISAGSIGAYSNTALGTGALTMAASTTLYVGRAVSEIANDIILSGAATIDFDSSVDYLIVAGGGSGGVGRGGGGGAGGVLANSTDLAGGTYAVVVGAGGAAVSNDNQGLTGGNSTAFGLTANGGGGGGGWLAKNGLNGGSGGGASGGAGTAGTGTAGQGYDGTSIAIMQANGGGGGGAGVAASASNGGVGIQSYITGSSVWVAGGGGAGACPSCGGVAGTGGTGGGAAGLNQVAVGNSGTANTGGGGGGVEGLAGTSGAGGSGVVIVRYLGGDAGSGAAESTGTGTAAGYTINTFTSSGTLNLNALATSLKGVISGANNLTLNSTGGTFTLTNTNTYSGNTTISGGTVVIGSTGSLGSGNYAGQILNSGTLKYSSSTNQTFSGVVSGTGDLIKDTSASASLTLSAANTYSGATTISAGDLIIRNNAPSTTSASFSGSGKLTIEPSGASFTSVFSTSGWTLNSNLGGLTLGKDGNAQGIAVASTTSIAGPITIYGSAIALTGALTATGSNTVTLKASGSVTQTGAITSTNLLLLGSGSFTLSNSSNAISTLAANGVAGLTFVDSNALTIGTVGSANGVSASGVVSIGTSTGDLTVSQDVKTTNATSTALVLNAGIATATGTSTGGNIVISGSPAISVGSSGTAKLYSGSVSGSTGLTSLIGSGTGNFRYKSDETTTNYTTALSTGLNAIYREAITATVTATSQTVTYGDTITLLGTNSGLVNGDSPGYSITSALYSTSNNLKAGTYTIAANAAAGLGYTLTSTNGTLTVNKKGITISGFAVADKTYDGATTATVTNAGSVSGQITNDVVSVSTVTAVFGDKNAGANKALTISGGTLTGTDSANYTATISGSTTASITAKAVTLTAPTISKTYDGGLTYTATAANLTTVSSALVSGDAVTAITLAFADKNAGAANKTVTPSSATISDGNSGNNYTITYANNTASTINKATVSLSATKVYDGGTSLTGVVTVTTGVGSETLTYTGATASNANFATPSKYISAITLADGTGGVATNYQLPTLNATNAPVTITAKGLTITANNDSKTFGTAKTYGAGSTAFTSSGLVGSETIGSVTITDANSGGLAAANAGGTYALTPSVATGGTFAASNYSITYTNAGTGLTVNKATLTVTADNKNMTYGASSLPSLTATITGFVNSQTLGTSGVTGSAGLTTVATAYDGSTAGSASVVGDYTITAAVGTLSASNYQFSYSNGTLSVGRANLTITAANDSKVYGATTTAASIAYTSGVAAGVATGYTTSGLVNGDTISSLTLSSAGANATATVAGGPYTITPSALSGSTRTSSSNYSITYTNAGTGLTVNKATLTVTANDQARVYGDANPTLTYAITGYVNSETAANAGVTGTPTISTTATAGSNVSTYTITSGANTLAAGNYQFTYVNGTLTVNRRPVTAIADAKSRIYGDANPNLTYTLAADGTGTSRGLYNSQTLTGALATTAAAATGVGTVAITQNTLTNANNANYDITYTAANLTINRATLTVTADNQARVYGDSNPVLTYAISGYKNSEDATLAGLTGTPTISTNATAASNVTTYTITSAANNLAAANYQFSYVNGTLTVNRRPVTVTADDKARTYGAANPSLTYVVVADGTGTSRGLYSTDTLSGALATTASATTGVGSVSITQGTVTNSGNASYDITYTAGTLTVNQKALTITADARSTTYGTALVLGTTGYTSSGLVNSDAIIGVTMKHGANTTVPATQAAGTYTNEIVASAATGTGLSNYNITYATNTLTVNKATLTFTADNKSRVYGDSNPALTYTTSGYVNSETAANAGVTGAPSITTTATAASNVTTYTITSAANDLAAANYQFSYANGTLTVNRRPVTVTGDAKTKIYGDSNPALTYTVSADGSGTSRGLYSTDTLTGALATTATALTGVSGVNITQGTLTDANNSNYAITYNNGTLTINKATLTYNATAANSTYGSTPIVNAGTVTGYVNSETSSVLTGTLLFSTTATSTSNIGSYAITGSGYSSNNYQFVQAAGNNTALTIGQKTLTVTASSQSTTYGTALALGTSAYSTTGLVNNDAVSAVTLLQGGNTTVPATQGAGTYTGSTNGILVSAATGTGLANYSISYVPNTLTINKATLTVTADNQSRVYGDANPTLTFVIAGFVNGQNLGNSGVTGTPTISTTATAASNVTTYTITSAANDLAAANYQFSYANGTLTVNRRPVTVTADDKARIYGAANPTLTYTVAADGTGTSRGLYSTNTLTGAVATAAVATTNVGTAAITQNTLTNANNSNYDITFNNGTLSINKATLTVTADAKSMTYGASSLPSLTATITGFVNSQTLGTSGVTGSASLSTTATAYDGSTAGSASVVGPYAITPTVGSLAASNYDFSYTNGSLTVGKANLTITAANDSKIYGATTTAANIAYTSGVAAGVSTGYSTAGLVNGDTISSVTLSSTGTNATSTVASGPYSITPSALSGSSRVSTDNYNITYSNAATGLTVNQKALTITADARSTTYGTALVLGTTAYTSSGLVNSDSISGVTMKHGTNTTVPVTQAAATYTNEIIASAATGSGLGNYSITYVANTLTVNQKALTITANNDSKTYGDLKTYGAGLSSLTSSGLVNGETIGSVTVTETNSGGLATASAGGSYALTPSAATGGTFSTANYSITYVAGALTVNQKALTITADARSTTYGTALVLGTTAYTSTGLTNSDSISGVTLTQAGNTTVPATQGANTYIGSTNGVIPSDATGSGLSNYSITFTASALTINKATLTFTADNQSRVYGDVNPTLIYTVTGYVNNETGANAGVTGAPIIATAVTAVSDVGSYAITTAANNLAAANYQFAYADGTLVVNQRPITVTANANQSKVYGDANPSYYYSIEALGSSRGLVAGDLFTGALARAAGENVGTYAINQGTVTNSNYAINYVADSFVIRQRPIIITANVSQSKIYGDTDPTFTYSLEALGASRGLVGLDAFNGALARAAGSNVGVYMLNQGSLNNANYQINFVADNFAINKARLSLVGVKVYNGQIEFESAQASNLSLSGVLGETFAVSGSATMGSKNVQSHQQLANVNGFVISNQNNGLLSNYEVLATTDTDIGVTVKPITLTAPVLNKTYDGGFTYNMTAADLDAMTAQLLGGDKVAAATVGFSTKDVGANKLVALSAATIDDGNGGANYNISLANSITSQISPAPLKITAVSDAKFVTKVDPTFAVIYNGFVNGETASVVSAGAIQSTAPCANAGCTNAPAGAYILNASGFASSNYNITYVAGSYTVVPANSLLVRVSPATVTYGNNPSYTITPQYMSSNGLINTLNAQDNGVITVNDGAGSSSSFVISATSPQYSSSGKLVVGGYNLSATNAVVSGANFSSNMVLVGSLTVEPKTLNLNQLGLSGVSKVYDGGTNISGLTLNVNSAQSSIRSGDAVAITATGTYQDRNVGTNKAIDVNIALSGADAGNYAISSTRVTSQTNNVYGTISQLASVTWVGPTAGGRWSNASNWLNGALPDAANVAQVIIPTGVNVIFDGALVGQVNSTIINSGTISFNGVNNFNFNSNVSGVGSIDQAGLGILTISGNNSFTGNVNINSASLVLASATALGSGNVVSNGGSLSATATLSSLLVNGPVTLTSDIATTGNQTYNGAVTLGAGDWNSQTQLLTPLTLTANNANITFNSILISGATSAASRRSLSINAGAGTVTFNGQVGAAIVNTLYGNFAASSARSIYQLSVTGAKIALNADVTSLYVQTYTGDILVGDNGTNGMVRSLISMDPAINIIGKVDDSSTNTHDLVLMALAETYNNPPSITIVGDIGSVKPLHSVVKTLMGVQNPDGNSKIGDLDPGYTSAPATFVGKEYAYVPPSSSTKNASYAATILKSIKEQAAEYVAPMVRKGMVEVGDAVVAKCTDKSGKSEQCDVN